MTFSITLIITTHRAICQHFFLLFKGRKLQYLCRLFKYVHFDVCKETIEKCPYEICKIANTVNIVFAIVNSFVTNVLL